MPRHRTCARKSGVGKAGVRAWQTGNKIIIYCPCRQIMYPLVMLCVAYPTIWRIVISPSYTQAEADMSRLEQYHDFDTDADYSQSDASPSYTQAEADTGKLEQYHESMTPMRTTHKVMLKVQCHDQNSKAIYHQKRRWDIMSFDYDIIPDEVRHLLVIQPPSHNDPCHYTERPQHHRYLWLQ